MYYGRSYLATVTLGLWSLVLCIFCLGLAIGVVIAVGMLFYFQARAIIRNRTGIEEWIIEKAKYRRETTNEKFIYPYDLGVKKNIEQVANWSCAPVGDGTSWAIVDECDQYTLTREQIEQKAEKRARTRTYSINRKVSGSWIPIFSQGFKVCLNPPCTDEPRIKLNIGDVIKVTRWRKHWLFGEKVKLNETKEEMLERRIRGWFPRQCAVELVENESDNSQKHFNSKKKK